MPISPCAGEMVSALLLGVLGILSLDLVAGLSTSACGCTPQLGAKACAGVSVCLSAAERRCICLWPSSGHLSMHCCGLGPTCAQ